MKNKAALIFVIMIGLFVTLTCRQWTGGGNNSSNSSNATAKEWKSYDLDETDIRVDLPGKPIDKTPQSSQLPPNYKSVFSAVHIYAYDEKEFNASMTELVLTGNKKWQIKELADTSMTALKRQLPDLTYTLDTKSETNTKYNGSFTRSGKNYDVRGCCVYKTDKPGRVWTALTLFPHDNVEAQNAGQRVIDSVVFKGSSEQCK